MEYFGHLAFGLIALSFLFRDMFWLRFISIAASVAGIVFNYAVPAHPLWLVIYWNVAFIAVNLVQIAILIYQRRSISFTEEERELYETVFYNLAPVEFLKLMRQASWHTAAEGDTLAREGETLERIMLIYSGRASVWRGPKWLSELSDGNFVGEVSFLNEQPATATVRAKLTMSYLSWPKPELRKLLNRNPCMRFALESALSADLSKKLKLAKSTFVNSGQS